MDMTIPSVLKVFSSAGSAVAELMAWKKRSKGKTRALLAELKDNLAYLDMVAEDNVPLSDVADKLSVTAYRQLAAEGFNFNTLKRAKITAYPSLENTDLKYWAGRETEDLIESIYDKINDIQIRYPHVGDSKNYRWQVRVNNIRKRIWLLLRHMRD